MVNPTMPIDASFYEKMLDVLQVQETFGPLPPGGLLAMLREKAAAPGAAYPPQSQRGRDFNCLFPLALKQADRKMTPPQRAKSISILNAQYAGAAHRTASSATVNPAPAQAASLSPASNRPVRPPAPRRAFANRGVAVKKS